MCKEYDVAPCRTCDHFERNKRDRYGGYCWLLAMKVEVGLSCEDYKPLYRYVASDRAAYHNHNVVGINSNFKTMKQKTNLETPTGFNWTGPVETSESDNYFLDLVGNELSEEFGRSLSELIMHEAIMNDEWSNKTTSLRGLVKLAAEITEGNLTINRATMLAVFGAFKLGTVLERYLIKK